MTLLCTSVGKTITEHGFDKHRDSHDRVEVRAKERRCLYIEALVAFFSGRRHFGTRGIHFNSCQLVCDSGHVGGADRLAIDQTGKVLLLQSMGYFILFYFILFILNCCVSEIALRRYCCPACLKRQ
jgi:hypothetical protein